MLRHVALSALMVCLITCYAHGWAPRWGDKEEEAPMEKAPMEKEGKSGIEKDMDMYKDMEMHEFVAFLMEAVKQGDLCEKDAWALIEHYKYMKHCAMKKEAMIKGMGGGMSWSSEEKGGAMSWSAEEEAKEPTKPEEEEKAESDAEMTDMKMKHKKALKMLSHVLMKDGASEHYDKKEWAGLLHHIVFSHENRKDPIIDLSQKSTMKVSARFWAPEMEMHLCGVKYTLPEVHEEVSLDGAELVAAQNRHEPEVHITGLHGDPVHDGLYTMLWVDRAPLSESMGSVDTPFLTWMVINIPGCDVAKGDYVKCYFPSVMTDNMQVFVYQQHDYIHGDFAIADYTESDNCLWQHRCHFEHTAFVDAYHLCQRAVGHLVVHPDPYASHLAMDGGYMNHQDVCVFYLDVTLPRALKHHNVDAEDKLAIKKAFKEYTSHYVCEDDMKDKHTMYFLKAQYGSLVNTLVHKFPTDNVLIPNYVEFSYDLGLWFHAEADSIELCDVWFDLPKVNRKEWINKWTDGEIVKFCSAEIRNAPMVKIVEVEHMMNPWPDHMDMKDKLFTLIIADRSDFGTYLANEVKPATPYINWMVINIKGCDVESGRVVVPYMPWSLTEGQYVFLYQQHDLIYDLPMIQYTNIDCPSEFRCRFQQARFVWDFDLSLVGAGRYETEMCKDIYGATFPMRRGNQTPNDACDVYMSEKKKLEEAAEEMEAKGEKM